MDDYQFARQLVREGRYVEALERLNNSFPGSERAAADTLLIEVLERTGRYSECRELIARLYRSRTLTPSLKSACELVLARMEIDAGRFDAAIQHLQRSITLAGSVGDLELVCRSQLRLFSLMSDRAGHDSGTPLLATLRSNVLKLGRPTISAALHLAVAEVDGRRGLLASALHHTEIAQRLLEPETELWYESWAENHLLAIAVLRADFGKGLEHGTRALAIIERSGAVAARRTCLANLGNLYYATGDFRQAVDHLQTAHSCLPPGGEHASASLESLARVRLSQGQLDDCEAMLDAIEQSIQSDRDRSLYAYRHSLLTRAQLLLQRSRWAEAHEVAARTLVLATAGQDSPLQAHAHLVKAESSAALEQFGEAASALMSAAALLAQQPPDIYVRYERALAVSLLAQGAKELAQRHLARALSVCNGLHVPTTNDLEALSRDAIAQHPESLSSPPSVLVESEVLASSDTLQNIIAVLLNAERPDVVASGIATLLKDTGALQGASVEGRPKNMEECQTPVDWARTAQTTDEVVLRIGSARDRAFIVRGRPNFGLEATAALNGVRILIEKVQELEVGRVEREANLALWPVEEVPVEGDHAVLTGRMRELMTFARRVARTNVGVLITGESGTGKEILARAIHSYSARASKPFVPFNCTAIPRELLESQLFGHRRGAFTGAERDHPGLIRAAKEGTLFLDEIGELTLDLQPKLLRFLESGEINPLGEPSPFNVDVRIIAATNSNLEQLVQDQRFREDLFYRLNVIRLTIPPLRERRDEIPPLVHHFVARASAEFSKGHVRVAEETMEHLLLFPWPGNVRQLNNELRRMVALADNDAVLTPSALSPAIRRATPRPAARASNGLEISIPLTDKLTPTIARIEKEMIRVALRAHHGHVDRAAKALGISRKGLYLKRQRLGL